MARVGCLLVPDLPLVAELRANPELAGQPLAVVSGPSPRAELVALSDEARAEGLRRGMTVAHARAVCAALVVRIASPAAERAAREALLDVALASSPRAEPAPWASGAFAGEAAVHLDASGVDTLFRSEAGFAASVAARAYALGLPAHVAIASSRDVSRIAARLPSSVEGEVRILAPGAEAEFLSPLSIDLLDPDDAIVGTLTRFGVHTVRDLLALPRRGLSTRLGPRVLSLIALARGESDDTPLPAPTSARLVEALDLEHPVDRLQPLLFVLQGMLSRLLARLEARHLACGDLVLTLELAGGGRDVRRIGLAAPTHDLRALIRLSGHALESRPPEAPIEGVAVETEGRPVRSDQLDLFRPAGPSPAVLDETLAALQSLCGEERVGTPTVADDHHPDAFRLTPFSLTPRSNTQAPLQARQRRARSDGPREARPGSEVEKEERSGAPPPGGIRSSESEVRGGAPPPGGIRSSESEVRGGAPPPGGIRSSHPEPTPHTTRLALRALRPPVAAQVEVHHHQPAWIRSAVAQGRVVQLAGPWRTTGGWWSQEGRFAFDSFDVQTSDGTVSRLRYDHVRRTWEVDAIYD